MPATVVASDLSSTQMSSTSRPIRPPRAFDAVPPNLVSETGGLAVGSQAAAEGQAVADLDW